MEVCSDSSIQNGYRSSELSSLLDPQKFSAGNVSPQIKNFYKKLIETDAQIKILKKGLYSPSHNSNKDSMYRLKRSLFRIKAGEATTHAAKSQAKPAEKKNKGVKQEDSNKKINTKASKKPSNKVKRFENGSLVPEGCAEGYVYRKKQVLIKYLQSPGNKPTFPKCSHVQKNEDNQDHPYNKNSEKLNQLLSKFLDVNENIQMSVSNVTPTLSPPTAGNSSTAESKKTTFVDAENKLTKPASADITEEKKHGSINAKKKLWNPWSSAAKTNKKHDSQESDGMDTELKETEKKNDRVMDYVTIPQYVFAFSMSTPTTPKYLFQKGGKWKKSINKNRLSDEDDRVYESDKMSKIPSRKLQQFDDQEEDEEGLGYEDFKEVLSDESDGHDEGDRQGERNRRDYNQDNDWKEVPPSPKVKPVGVFNRNWKGPVLLYPDELSSVMSKTFQTSMPTAQPSIDDWQMTLNMGPSSNNTKELDYLVDFLKNKDEETLTDLAQAYSDYGVLSELTENPRIYVSQQPNTSTLIDVNDDKNGKPNDDVINVKTTMVQNNNPFITVSRKNKFKKLNKSSKNRSKRETGKTTSMEKVNNLSNSSEFSKQAENNIAKVFNKFTNDIEAIEQSSGIRTTNVQDEDMNPGDFLTLLSNWFGTLASMSENTDNLTAALVKNISAQPTFLTSPKTKSRSEEIKQPYPVYDSDMVDNIGHRSRVLMSIKEDHTNLAHNSSQESTSMQNKALVSESYKAGNTTELVKENKTKSDTIIIVTRSSNTDKMPNSNDTIFKRSVRGDEDFVFWNDMYDDEYGLKMDPLDEEKVLGKRTESVVKKSTDWIQNKVKQMTDTIKRRSKNGANKLKLNKRENRDTGGSRLKNFLKTNSHKINKRDSDTEHATPLQDIPTKVYDRQNFALMTAHMKEICNQAAEAVQKTRSIKPREDHESEAARGLMQNLVKLMSDLVDFEVQKRTCLSLPSDLKDFLDWLTNPVPIPAPQNTKNVQIVYSGQPETDDPLIDIATTQSSEREVERTDARSECLGTLLAVQDLMMDYSKLSDADKSKMYGVKEYLEDQMDFLNKQIENSDEVNHVANVYSKDLLSARRRRDLLKNPEFQRRRQYRHQNRNKRRFLKNYSKKHTVTTPTQFDSLRVSTESVNRFTYIQDSVKTIPKVNEEIEKKKREVEQVKEDNVRSLQNVYYKALEDAKKETTPREAIIVNSEGNST